MKIKEFFAIHPVHLDGVPQTWLNDKKCKMSLESGMVMLRTTKMTVAVPLTNVSNFVVDPSDPRAKEPAAEPLKVAK